MSTDHINRKTKKINSKQLSEYLSLIDNNSNILNSQTAREQKIGKFHIHCFMFRFGGKTNYK